MGLWGQSVSKVRQREGGKSWRQCSPLTAAGDTSEPWCPVILHFGLSEESEEIVMWERFIDSNLFHCWSMALPLPAKKPIAWSFVLFLIVNKYLLSTYPWPGTWKTEIKSRHSASWNALRFPVTWRIMLEALPMAWVPEYNGTLMFLLPHFLSFLCLLWLWLTSVLPKNFLVTSGPLDILLHSPENTMPFVPLRSLSLESSVATLCLKCPAFTFPFFLCFKAFPSSYLNEKYLETCMCVFIAASSPEHAVCKAYCAHGCMLNT